MKNQEADVVASDVMAVVQQIDDGVCLFNFNKALQEVVAAVEENHGKGSVSLTIEIEPLKGSVKKLAVTGNVKTKAPRAPMPASVFFTTKQHTLTRVNPDQMEFSEKDDSFRK